MFYIIPDRCFVPGGISHRGGVLLVGCLALYVWGETQVLIFPNGDFRDWGLGMGNGGGGVVGGWGINRRLA